jgi:hypothetical protein
MSAHSHLSLSGYFRYEADECRRKAQEDEGYVHSAANLDSLADYVENEGARWAAVLEPFLLDEMLGGYETGEAVQRYGYPAYRSTSPAQHEDFLEELAVLCVWDTYYLIYEFANRYPVQERDPTGSLYDFELDAADEGVWLPRRYFERRARLLTAGLDEDLVKAQLKQWWLEEYRLP